MALGPWALSPVCSGLFSLSFVCSCRFGGDDARGTKTAGLVKLAEILIPFKEAIKPALNFQLLELHTQLQKLPGHCLNFERTANTNITYTGTGAARPHLNVPPGEPRQDCRRED